MLQRHHQRPNHSRTHHQANLTAVPTSPPVTGQSIPLQPSAPPPGVTPQYQPQQVCSNLQVHPQSSSGHGIPPVSQIRQANQLIVALPPETRSVQYLPEPPPPYPGHAPLPPPRPVGKRPQPSAGPSHGYGEGRGHYNRKTGQPPH